MAKWGTYLQSILQCFQSDLGPKCVCRRYCTNCSWFTCVMYFHYCLNLCLLTSCNSHCVVWQDQNQKWGRIAWNYEKNGKKQMQILWNICFSQLLFHVDFHAISCKKIKCFTLKLYIGNNKTYLMWKIFQLKLDNSY